MRPYPHAAMHPRLAGLLSLSPMAIVHLTRVQKKVAAALAVGVVLYVYVGGRYSERVAQDNFRVF